MQTNTGSGSSATKERSVNSKPDTWLIRYSISILCLGMLWYTAYAQIEDISCWLVFDMIGLDRNSHLGASIQFFLYDTVKILLLLVALIYAIAWVRAALNTERVRDFLAGKKRSIGYGFGAIFGAITPFCSCSSVPLFLGFTAAGIPVGITMSFLITSPLINEIAVVLLWGLLGWKFTVVYAGAGILAGIIGGILMDSIGAEKWLQPFVRESMKSPVTPLNFSASRRKPSIQQRHTFAYGEMTSIFKRVWKWVIAGVAIGAALHGLVPENWFAENLGAGQWWTVPAAVIVGIPLYSNVTGIVPVMEGLLTKGMPIGTTMAFCMSAVAASIPEVVMLRQVMTIKLQAVFITYLWLIFTLMGWLLNSLQGKLF